MASPTPRRFQKNIISFGILLPKKINQANMDTNQMHTLPKKGKNLLVPIDIFH